jgi:hypothetical protein
MTTILQFNPQLSKVFYDTIMDNGNLPATINMGMCIDLQRRPMGSPSCVPNTDGARQIIQIVSSVNVIYFPLVLFYHKLTIV